MIDPNTATDLTVGGLLVPPVVALLNQRQWDPKLKALVAFLACLLAAAGLAAWHGTLDVAHWRNTAIHVVAAALGMYALWWRPSTIAPSLESATTLRSGPRHASPQ